MYWPVLKFGAEQAKNANLMAIRNRLALLESFRLNRKLLLDREGLTGQGEDWKAPNGPAFKVQSQLTIISGMPHHPTKEDRQITLTISFKQLIEQMKLSELQGKALKLLLANRYDNESEIVTLTCARFPFQAQNKKWILDKLKEAVDYAREKWSEEIFQRLPEDLFYKPVERERKFTFEKIMGIASEEYLKKIK